MKNWIEKVKHNNIDSILGTVGMKRLRMNSLSPCPSCSREFRSKGDKRGPIGTDPKAKSWACFRCGANGDIVDLMSFFVCGSKFKDVSKEDKQEVKSYFQKIGLLHDDKSKKDCFCKTGCKFYRPE